MTFTRTVTAGLLTAAATTMFLAAPAQAADPAPTRHYTAAAPARLPMPEWRLAKIHRCQPMTTPRHGKVRGYLVRDAAGTVTWLPKRDARKSGLTLVQWCRY